VSGRSRDQGVEMAAVLTHDKSDIWKIESCLGWDLDELFEATIFKLFAIINHTFRTLKHSRLAHS
jgi:hypothetical protein